jgi:hypothetical protein
MITRIKKLMHAQSLTTAMKILSVALIVVMIFSFGEFVGFRKAAFTFRQGEQYFRNFDGPQRGFGDEIRGRGFLGAHGTIGTVLSVSSSSIVMKGRESRETSVLIQPNTSIMRFRDKVDISAISPGTEVVIIGSSNNDGVITAQLIRILPALPTK